MPFGRGPEGARSGTGSRLPSTRAKAHSALKVPLSNVGIVLYEPITGSIFKAAWAEFICTLLLIYWCTGTICFGCHSSDVSTSSSGDSGGQSVTPVDCFLNSTRVQTIATSFGVAFVALSYAASAFSGGHLNPAVTLAFLITRQVSLVKAAFYWVAQLAGAILGSFLVKYTDLTGFAAATGGANRLLKGLPPSAAWLLECILTFALVFIVFIATDQKRAGSTPHLPVLAPLGIGFAVFACHLAAVAIDGCSINPARSFGPAVTSGHWKDHWVFWVGPGSGAMIAALVYEFTFRPSQEQITAIDHREDGAPGDQAPTKLPGYTGAGGLPPSHEAKQKLAAHRDGPAEEGLRGKDLHQPKQNGSRPHSGYNAELKNSRQSEMLTSRSRMLDDEAIPSDALHMV